MWGLRALVFGLVVGAAVARAEAPLPPPPLVRLEEALPPPPLVRVEEGQEDDEGARRAAAVEDEAFLTPPPPVLPAVDRPRTDREFLKGELTRVGPTRLLGSRSRVGVRLGYAYLEGTHYGVVMPELDFQGEHFRLGLGVPLRLEVFGLSGVADAGRLRAEDYDEPSDFAKIVRVASYGQRGEGLFLQVSQLDAQTVGHGALVQRYFANADVDGTRVGLEAEHSGALGGFELVVNDVLAPWVLAGADPGGVGQGLGVMVAALVFVRPLALFSEAPLARSLSLGVSWAGELNAPLALAQDATGRIPVDERRNPIYQGGLVDLAALDAELELWQGPAGALKPYADLAFLRGQARGGWGLGVGLLGRRSWRLGEAPDDVVHALRGVLEVRTHAANFDPGFFDTFYEIEKYAFDRSADGGWRTKWEAVTARDPEMRAIGAYLELEWALVDKVAVGSALELSSLPGESSFYLHVEAPALTFLQLFLTWHKRGLEDAAQLLDFAAGDSVVFGAARLRLLPVLYLNARVYRAFQFDESPAVRQFRGVTGIEGDLELSFEF